MNTFRFEHMEYLWLLAVIPALAGLYVIISFMKKRNMKDFGESLLLKRLMPDFSSFRYHFKFVLMLVAAVLIIFALAGPQFGSKLVDVRQKGLEIIIALDVSNSMLAEDIKPNRLERAKQELSRLMDRLENDRVGLIVFAGEAYTQIPITSDILSAKMFLSGINTDMVSRQGTAIGAAIELAIKSFTQDQEVGRAIIVISDGENHEGDVMEACRKADERNISIFTIGMGQGQGVRIPVSSGPYNKDYLRDQDGNFVVSEINEKMLLQIASAGNGKYYRASTPGMGLNDIISQLKKLEQAETTSQVYAEYEEQFPYFIWTALFILVLDLFILERRNKWLNKLK
ncbi:MAG: VWA domain-containing protein [Bacteroidales bacterium]|nr:VWA domain-containing protein [Bacteroidales bacterium]